MFTATETPPFESDLLTLRPADGSAGAPRLRRTENGRQPGPTGFWYLQAGAWLTFGTAMALGRIGELPALAILVIDGPFALTGFGTTLLLRVAFVGTRAGEGPVLPTLGLVLGCAYLAGMLWTATFHTYLHSLAVPWLHQTYPGMPLPIRPAPVLDNTVYNTLTLVAWSMFYVGLVHRDLLQAQRDSALLATAEARDAQLKMLEYQLNPHFLFNTLNSIRTLVDENPGRARGMITELAHFLRYALLDRPLRVARLAEEVAAVRGYLAIESIRFEERLDVHVDVSPEAERVFVPASC
jgi:hypothetical protein